MGGGASTESRRLSAPFHIALPIVGELPTVDGDRHLTVCLEQNTVLYIHAASFQLLPPPASATETRRRLLVRLYSIGAHEFPTCWSAEVCEGEIIPTVRLACVGWAKHTHPRLAIVLVYRSGQVFCALLNGVSAL